MNYNVLVIEKATNNRTEMKMSGYMFRVLRQDDGGDHHETFEREVRQATAFQGEMSYVVIDEN